MILAIAVSKRCTQDLPVVNTHGSSTADFCVPTIRPFGFQKNLLKEYFFSGIVDFEVPFSINACVASGGWVPMGQGAATAIHPKVEEHPQAYQPATSPPL